MPTLNKGLISQANVYQAFWTAPVGSNPSIDISLCNVSDAPVTVSIAIHSGVPTIGDHIEYKFPLDPAGTEGNVLERTCVAISPGMQVWLCCTSANAVAAHIHGFTE